MFTALNYQADQTDGQTGIFSVFLKKKTVAKIAPLAMRKGKKNYKGLTSLLVEIGLKFIIATRKECGHQHCI